MTEVNVSFPNTNPIIFTRDGDYDPILDAKKHEVVPYFCQQFAENDLLSFQIKFSNAPEAEKAILEVIVNGVVYEIARLKMSFPGIPFFSTTIENSDRSTFWWRFKGNPNTQLSDLNAENVLFLSKRINEIKIGNNQLIKDGDVFQVRLRLWNDAYYSNKILCSNDTDGTKLIHYTSSDTSPEPTFGTYFNLMTRGYDIRLQADFLQVSQKANKEIFQTHKGNFDLVSSVPYETVKLQIGMNNGVGLPDWLIRNLNTIFHLDEKTIDGVGYELVEGAELESEIITGFNNRHVGIELSKKETETWRHSKGQTQTQIAPEIFVTYDDGFSRTGTITIRMDDNISFRLASPDDSFSNYAFSQTTGTGTTQIQFSSLRNVTENDIITALKIIDRKTDELIAPTQLELPAVTTGICFWEVCNNFIIDC